jgi:hypothetical protein
MLRPLNFDELGKYDLISQAIIDKPISYFAKQGFNLVHDIDALDDFEGIAFYWTPCLLLLFIIAAVQTMIRLYI